MPDPHGTLTSLDEFRDQLHPSVVRDVESWRDHPELRELHAALHAHTDRRTFVNTLAEAMVARHLLHHECEVRFEVPTPLGRRADFEVRRGDARFFLHVKRLQTSAPARRRLTVSSRLRVLERIARPYIVSIRWHEGLTDRQMQRLVTEAERFITRSRVGDETTILDDRTERELGGVRILAPSDQPHVTLVIGLPEGFVDDAPRMRKLLKKAYQQFMPKHANMILLGTGGPPHERDADEFENALLGSHIERWDEFPPRGQRIAHGRDVDGFWHGQRYVESRAAGWFRFSLKEKSLHSRLWLREGTLTETPAHLLMRELFESG